MVNEEKIKLMASVALFQKKEKNRALNICRFSKKDYVVLHMILVWVNITIAFLGVSVLGLIYFTGQPDDVFAEFRISNLLLFGWILGYLVICIVFLLIAISCYSSRYSEALKHFRRYEQKLFSLQQFYDLPAGKEEIREDGWMKKNEQERIP